MDFASSLSKLGKTLEARSFCCRFVLPGAFLSFMLLCVAAYSQVSTATLVIAVEDQAGALVPDAAITLLNTATGISRTFQSNEEGLATASALQPGVYDISVEKPGFKKAVQPGFVLTVNQRARQTIVLQVGEVTESVTVEAGAPLVNTKTPNWAKSWTNRESLSSR